MISPTKGTILIANPFLKDPNFVRSVIFICENMAEGTFGFILNQIHPNKLNELIPDILTGETVYKGGPVQLDSLHFLHQYPDLIIGGIEVIEGVYWGGNFESLQIHLQEGNIDSDKIKFFVGYSGWAEGQLDFEMKEQSWLVANATKKLLFNTTPENIWKESLRHLGGKYEAMINYPLDPQLN